MDVGNWMMKARRWSADRWTMNINCVCVTPYSRTMLSRDIFEKGVFICLPKGEKSELILKRIQEKSLPQVMVEVSHYLA